MLSDARSLVETNGSASQKHIFYRFLSWQKTLERQWEIDEEIINAARLAVATAEEGGEDAHIYREKGPLSAWAAFSLGRPLLIRGELD